MNAIAVHVWELYRAQFRWYADDAGIGDQENIDGSETPAGEAYEGSAIFGHGQQQVSLFVDKIHATDRGLGFGVMVLKRMLASRGLSKEGGQPELRARLKAYLLMREGGATGAAAAPAAAAAPRPAPPAAGAAPACTACGKAGRLCLFRAVGGLPTVQLHKACCVGQYAALSAGVLKKKHGGGKAVLEALSSVRSAYNGEGEIYLVSEFEPALLRISY